MAYQHTIICAHQTFVGDDRLFMMLFIIALLLTRSHWIGTFSTLHMWLMKSTGTYPDYMQSKVARCESERCLDC